MKKVALVFRDISSLSEFLLTYKVSNAEVNSIELSLVANLSEDEIITACTEYKARIKVEYICAVETSE